MSTPTTVAVVGAGASGTLAAAHVARTAARTGAVLDLLLVDPQPPGPGLAYSTTDPRHRLNVPAKGMSAWPDDPPHFLRWLRRHVSCDFPETGFAPRLHYAQYLVDVLEEAAAGSGARVVHVAARATDLRPVGRRLRLSLDDGTSRPADAAVLATGHGRPSVTWAPAELLRAPQFVADPWSGAAEPQLRRGDEVVLVGAGLTAADMALRWGRAGVRLHVVSRHGMLPLPHAVDPAPAVPADLDRLPRTLPELRRAVFGTIRAAGGDWRRAIDGLRPVTGDLWRGLDDAGRAEFLYSAVRRWDRVRHRVDPALADWLEQRRAEGSLLVHGGSVVAAEAGGRTVRVSLSDGTTIDAAAVLNCTGTGTGVSTSADPLVLNLLTSGLAVPGPLDLGFRTDGTGRLVSASGASPAIWTIGPLRRGELWESTAIPEIRVQAGGLARPVLEALPGPRTRRRPRDAYGLPLSTSTAAGAAYNAALGRILCVQSGAEELLRDAVTADPEFALGQATLALLGAEWGVEVDVNAALAAASAPSARADERERRFVEVATARVRRPGAESAATLLSYIQAYPEDALAVSVAVPTIAFGGATEVPAEAWALVEGLGAAYGEDWWYLGLLAFIRQEQDRFAEAGELAARALLLEPAAGHAVHAKAHVHYETGDHRAGLAWLDRWIATCGARASHRAHFAWHAALHELALGDDAAVARRYREQLAPPVVTGVRALVDSASLLWRARMVGGAVPGEIAAVLASVPAGLLAEPPTPFAALHAALALAAAGDCRGLARLRRAAERHPEEPFRAVVAPLADALCDLTHGDADRALAGLLALPELTPLGGSAAQREVVEETLLHCAVEAGRAELAADLLARRLERRESVRDRRRRAALLPT
jgi:uncharacterized NAD(P)/FAD-binding protein YdhS